MTNVNPINPDAHDTPRVAIVSDDDLKTMSADDAVARLKEIQRFDPSLLTADELSYAIALTRIVRRTTAGPAAAKTSTAKKATLKSMNLDDLLDL